MKSITMNDMSGIDASMYYWAATVWYGVAVNPLQGFSAGWRFYPGLARRQPGAVLFHACGVGNANRFPVGKWDRPR